MIIIQMSQQDFLGPFPPSLKPDVLQQKNEEEYRQYVKTLYESCLEKIGKRKFPCNVDIPSSNLSSKDYQRAIDYVKTKIREGGYDINAVNVQYGMNDYGSELQITIAK